MHFKIEKYSSNFSYIYFTYNSSMLGSLIEQFLFMVAAEKSSAAPLPQYNQILCLTADS